MELSQFEYNLPKELIAQEPPKKRDEAKLLVLDKASGKTYHKRFFQLPKLLTSNDVLVFNKTKVFPARLQGRLFKNGKDVSKIIEILLLSQMDEAHWKAMHKGKVSVDDEIRFEGVDAKVIEKLGYEVTLKFNTDISDWIDKNGQTPLPPYISSKATEENLRQEYQTVFATNEGSVAAPTAGLHFTDQLIRLIEESGVQVEYVTLHVGAGTFLPMKEQNITNHHMHSEYWEIDTATLARLNEAKLSGKRIVAVGTTTTRVLETLSNENSILQSNKLSGETDIFIFPPYKFKFVDALITNFHLPHSTLLALVSAFVCKPNTPYDFHDFISSLAGNAYLEAIEREYKFYSFGDGMMIG